MVAYRAVTPSLRSSEQVKAIMVGAEDANLITDSQLAKVNAFSGKNSHRHYEGGILTADKSFTIGELAYVDRLNVMSDLSGSDINITVPEQLPINFVVIASVIKAGFVLQIRINTGVTEKIKSANGTIAPDGYMDLSAIGHTLVQKVSTTEWQQLEASAFTFGA